MKPIAGTKNCIPRSKSNRVLPLLMGLVFSTGLVCAQGTSDASAASPTRAQVKMERDEFIKTHRWDQINETWTFKGGVEAPAGMKSRAEIKAARDEFLRNNKYDQTTESWVPLKAEPRNLSGLTREQMRAEIRHFARTHEWNPLTDQWDARTPSKKK